MHVASHDLFNMKLRTCLDTGATLAGIAQNAEQIYCLTPAKMAIQLDVNTKIWHYVTAPSLHD